MKRYFKNSGYKVKPVKGEDIVNKPIPKADTYILSFWNSDDVTDALHTVSMKKTNDGHFELFNYKSNKNNLSEKIESLDYKFMINGNIPIVVYCISK